MDPKYQTWIDEHYPTPKSALMQCAGATAKMVKAFPELTRIRGHICVMGDMREHWWCQDRAGAVVDPTRRQYQGQAIVGYDPLPADAEEPVGKCHECGEYCFTSKGGNSSFCCAAHERSYMAYLNGV